MDTEDLDKEIQGFIESILSLGRKALNALIYCLFGKV